jgi:hypothetical protein
LAILEAIAILAAPYLRIRSAAAALFEAPLPEHSCAPNMENWDYSEKANLF